MKICIFKLKSAHRVLSIINGKKTTNYSSVKKKKKSFSFHLKNERKPTKVYCLGILKLEC